MNEKELSESILTEWLRVTRTIQNSRIVNGMTLNEALVCNKLWCQSDKEPAYLSAAELCSLTGISKSLMNRIVTSLLKKGIIEYADVVKDKRKKPLRLSPWKKEKFIAVHEASLDIVDELVKLWGIKSSKQILESLKKMHDGFETVMKTKERREKQCI